jgi:uncharacterized protein (TIGR00251 family)
VIEIVERDGGVIFAVRVIPRGCRNAIEGAYGEALKARLSAPALKNRANHALRRLPGDCLNVPRAAVRIVAGEKSRTKRISISGLTRGKVIELLGL